MKVKNIRRSGHYFKHFSGYDEVAQPVTVLDIIGDEVSFVRGHIPRYGAINSKTVMRCWANQILPPSPKIKEQYAHWLVDRLKETATAVEYLMIEKDEG